MGKKTYLGKWIAVMMLCCMVISGLPAGVSEAAKIDLSYYNARTNNETKVFGDDLVEVVRIVPANEPVHVLGEEKKGDRLEFEYNAEGVGVKQIITFLKVELTDGAVGWASKVRIEQKYATKEFFLAKDQYLRSKPDTKSALITTVFQGELVNVLEVSGKYSKVETNKKKTGWVSSAVLTKEIPKYLYASKTTPFYYNKHLTPYLVYKKEAFHGQQGSMSVGTQMEYVTTAVKNGLEEQVYLVLTPTKQLAYVDVSKVSFVLPTTIYSKIKTSLYEKSSDQSKTIATLAQGEKLTRIFSDGSYYKIKTKSGLEGWVKKADTSFQVIAKAIKSYGTYYVNQRMWRTTGDKWIVYPIGTKVIQMDNKFYSIEAAYGKQPKDTSKQPSHDYPLIKGQYPDGTVGFFDVTDAGNVTKKYKESLTQLRKASLHIKESEQLIFKQLNEFRKSQGLKEVEWSNSAYQYAESHFYYNMEYGSGNPHVMDEYGWYGEYTDIIYNGMFFDLESTKIKANNAMSLWKRSSGHLAMLIDNYEKAAVIVMYNQYKHQFQAVIMTGGRQEKFKFQEGYDNYIVKTWYPFLYENPKFTNNRGEAYTGYLS